MFGGKTIRKLALTSLVLLFVAACGSKYDASYDTYTTTGTNSCSNMSGDNVYTGEIQDSYTAGQIKLAINGNNTDSATTSYATIYGLLTINSYQFCCSTYGSATVRGNDGSYGFTTSDDGAITSLYLRCISMNSNSSGTVTVMMPQNCAMFQYGKVFMTGDKKLEGCMSVKSNYPDISSSYYNSDGSYLYFIK